MSSVRLGLDIGTTAVKAGAYDAAGHLVAHAQAGALVDTGPGGRSEQDMAKLWITTCTVLAELMGKLAGVEVMSLGVCAQGDGFWAIDADGAPVGPAMLWNDTRAGEDIAALNASGATIPVAHACHTSLWPGTSGVLWRRLPPETRQRIAHVFTCGDWIGLKLTGVVATDYSNASIPFLDLNTRAYSPAALAALDCGDLASRLLPPRPAASILGRIGPDAAAATGLPQGLPVSVPTLDLSAMILGMGLDRAGQAMMIMGTTAVVNILSDGFTPQDVPVGASVAHPTGAVIIRVLAPTTGAAAFDWFSGLHPLSLGGDSPGEVADKLNALVAQVPPGANGVTFLPYLNGERAPFVAPRITASFHGLTATSTRADMGRAVLEGTALSLRHCLEMEGGRPEGPVQLTGGGSRNPVWCQIIADIVGTEVEVSQGSDHGLWGAACLGAAAAGGGDAIALAARQDQRRRYTPGAGNAAAYKGVFARYRRISDAARALQDALNKKEER